MARVAAARSVGELRELTSEILGKRGVLARLHRDLGPLAPEERRERGQALNEARTRLEAAAALRRRELEDAEREAQLAADRIDLTEIVQLPDPGYSAGGRGHSHLVTRTQEELEDLFIGLGYSVAEGPEVETDWYNFEALNFPPGHPARTMHDTFFLEWGAPESTLLRTHTSPVQIRVMESQPPPIYSIMPGRCHRRDTADARHLPGFSQIEGLAVDRGITFGDLAGTIEAFTTSYFGPAIHSRLRPAFFPFTEPSAEFEITCTICEGVGCRTCSGTGWIELGGCGMVHPNVLAAVGIDSEEWTGFAFGFGIDRCAIMRHGIEDMRIFLDNDLRFLTQF
ncbi:MAG: phenylalanine--tRNA ligase subunit alpha [Acidimicrobiales bacterium]